MKNLSKSKTARDERMERIRAFILDNVEDVPHGLALYVRRALHVPASDVYAQVRCMVLEGLLSADGMTSRRRYQITERGLAARAALAESAHGNSPQADRDKELLKREPRTMEEAERKAWLLRSRKP